LKTIRVGIIGCGVIGPTHAEAYKALDDAELAWVCDLKADKAQNLAQRYAVPRVTTDYREVMADDSVDCVSVCTDHASHVPIVVHAMERGKHVLCEKALVANRKGLDLMFDAHRKHPGKAFGAVSQHRFEAINKCLKRCVDEGLFGTLLTASVQVQCFRSNAYYQSDTWRGTWAEEGGAVLINQAIHFIDMLVWIMGGVQSLCGTHTNLTHHGVIETEDTAVAALRFRNGALGTIEATSSSNLNWRQVLSFCGSAGTIVIEGGKPRIVSFADEAVTHRVQEDLQACQDGPGVAAGKDYYGTGHVGQIADFVAAVRDGRDPFVSGADVRNTVDVVLGIYESQKSGGWITLAD